MSQEVMKPGPWAKLLKEAESLGIDTMGYMPSSYRRLEARIAEAKEAKLREEADNPSSDVPLPEGMMAKATMPIADLQQRFGFHPASTEMTKAQHESIRAGAIDLAEFAVGVMPAGREASMAVTKLEEFMFWANAAIARNPADKIYGDGVTSSTNSDLDALGLPKENL
jgi:hypothetical protein